MPGHPTKFQTSLTSYLYAVQKKMDPLNFWEEREVKSRGKLPRLSPKTLLRTPPPTHTHTLNKYVSHMWGDSFHLKINITACTFHLVFPTRQLEKENHSVLLRSLWISSLLHRCDQRTPRIWCLSWWHGKTLPPGEGRGGRLWPQSRDLSVLHRRTAAKEYCSYRVLLEGARSTQEQKQCYRPKTRQNKHHERSNFDKYQWFVVYIIDMYLCFLIKRENTRVVF